MMDNCLVDDYNHCLSMQPQKIQMEAAFKTCNNNISSSSSNNEYWNTDTQNVTWTSNNELPYYQANLVDTTSMFSLSQSTSSNTSSPLSPSSYDNSVANEQLWIQQNNVFNTFKTLCGTNADQSSINDKSQSLEYSIPYSFYFSQMMEDGDEGMFFKNENHTPVGYMDIHPVSYSKCQDNQDFSGVHSSECIFQNNQQGLSAINILTPANSSDCGSITGHNTEMSVKNNDYEYIDNSDKNTVPIHHKIHHIKNDDKREKRRKQNRVAAKRCRERKKYKTCQLLKDNQSLQAAYKDVKKQLLELQKEKVRLQDMLSNHAEFCKNVTFCHC